MSPNTIRWLHLSDVRAGKNAGDQRDLFLQVISHVEQQKKSGFIPDFLFITGDVVHTGGEQEYRTFQDELLAPVQEAIGSGIDQRTFIVPGNHDILQSRNRGFDRRFLLRPTSGFFSRGPEGFEQRQIVLPRFESFRRLQGKFAEDWIGNSGSWSGLIPAGGAHHDVGVVLCNTAWLCKGDRDEGQLTPGSLLLEPAVRKIACSRLRIVLGHHPLEVWEASEREIIRDLFEDSGVLYLHGHVRQAETRFPESRKWPVCIPGLPVYRQQGGPQDLTGLIWAEFSPQDEVLWLQRRTLTGSARWATCDQSFPSGFTRELPDLGVWCGLTLPSRSPAPVRTRHFSVPVGTTKYIRKTRNDRLVYEHARRHEDEDVGRRKLTRDRMVLDQALAFFSCVLLLGEGGSGKTFATDRLYETLRLAVNQNDPEIIRDRYPDWRHATLPMPIRVDAPGFSDWLERDCKGEAGESRPGDPKLLRYAADNSGDAALCCPEADLETLKAHCNRESFVLILDDWGALDPDEARRVDAEVNQACRISSGHRPALIYTAPFDSAGYSLPERANDFERISIARFQEEEQIAFAAAFCLVYGHDVSEFRPVIERLGPIANTAGRFNVLLQEWRDRSFISNLPDVTDVNDIHTLMVFRSLEPGSRSWDSDEIRAVTSALLTRYLENPSAKVLRFRAALPLLPPETGSRTGFLRTHADGSYSVRQTLLQDYVIGRALWTSQGSAPASRIGKVLQSENPRREPLKCALLYASAQPDPCQSLQEPLDVLLSHSDGWAGVATVADFFVEAGGAIRRFADEALLDRARRRLCELLSHSSLSGRYVSDRYVIGQALSLCGDPRPGVAPHPVLDVPVTEWREVSGNSAKLGQTEGDRNLYGDTGVPPNDEPRKVQETTRFLLSKYPVTNIEFNEFVRDPVFGYDCAGPWAGLTKPPKRKWILNPGKENHPAASVSWDEATAYCRWYSRMTGTPVALPKSDLWEYAARGAEADRMFPFGEWIAGVANTSEEGLPGVSAVGAFPASDSIFGISDMCGNVFEWCEDEHHLEPDFKVTKGGSYNHERLRCRNATRGKKHRGSQHPYLGFRLIKAGEKVERQRIILVGGGFAATATAIRLMALSREPIEIVMIESEPGRVFGGFAYGHATAQWEHLFNLQAGRISLYREDRDDFVRWLKDDRTDRRIWHSHFHFHAFERHSAVPRRLYQEYLQERLRQAFADSHPGLGFRTVTGRVVDIEEKPKAVVMERNGKRFSLSCDQAVLCTGNLEIRNPSFVTEEIRAKERYVEDQYDAKARQAFKRLRKGQRVLVLGTALRAYDLVMTLRNPLSDLVVGNPDLSSVEISLLSRNGRRHPRYEPYHLHQVAGLPKPAFLIDQSSMSKEEFVRAVMEAYDLARDSDDLRDVPPELRPERILKAWEQFVPDALRRITKEDTIALLEEYRSLITVQRIGVVPEIDECIKQAMSGNMACHVTKAQVERITVIPDGFIVRFNDNTRKIFNLIVNCTGREQNYGLLKDGLWRKLMDRKLAVRHSLTGIGIDVDRHGMLLGDSGPSSWICAVGVMREGVEFERFGRLGSFSFTLGPIKNQAFESAVYLLRRLRPKPARALDKDPASLVPRRDGAGIGTLVYECINRAWSSTLGGLSGTEKMKERVDHHEAWSIAVDLLKSRTYSQREGLSERVSAFRERIARALPDEEGFAGKKRQEFTECFMDFLEEIALAHLIRLDEVEPGEHLLHAGGASRRIRNRVFICYASEDLESARLVCKHLQGLKSLDLHFASDIPPGTLWEDWIREGVATCSAAILIVSHHFQVSRVISDDELPPLLAAAKQGEVKLFPLMTSAVHLRPELGRLHFVNEVKRPLDHLAASEQHDELRKLAEKISEYCLSPAPPPPLNAFGAQPKNF